MLARAEAALPRSQAAPLLDDALEQVVLESLLNNAEKLGAGRLRLQKLGSRGVIRARVDGREAELALCSVRLMAAIQAAVLRRAGVVQGAREVRMAHGELPWPGAASQAQAQAQDDLLREPRFPFTWFAPSHGGPALRLELRPRAASLPALAQLGLEKSDFERLERVMGQPDGLVFVAGPAGSGRSTTLHALLACVDCAARSVQTIEAGIARAVPGWLQFDAAGQASGPAAGMLLDEVLHNAPDVLLFDAPCTAQSLDRLRQAASGGCLLLAPAPVGRAHHALRWLRVSGLGFEDQAQLLSLVLAQRLVRKLCPACALPDDSPELRAALARAANTWLGADGLRAMAANPRGCEQCRGSGYRGRLLLCEILEFDAGVRSMVEGGTLGVELEQRLLSQGHGLWDHGLRRIARGETSLQALRSVLHEPR
jgi:hypothetical protein